MLRKNHRPFSLTNWQGQQLKRISHSLRELNRAARRELRRIRYTGLTRTQYREVSDSVGTIATRMSSALRFHDEILKAEQEQEPLRIMVHFVTPCVHHFHHSESRQLTGNADDEAECEALKRAAHQAEIEPLLELTNSIEDLVSRRSMLRGAPLNAFFRAINRLKLAVLQQQQHLLATAPQLIPLFELHVADGPDICTDCLASERGSRRSRKSRWTPKTAHSIVYLQLTAHRLTRTSGSRTTCAWIAFCTIRASS
jgi:hypothetical protein